MSYTIDSELVLKSLSNPQHSAPWSRTWHESPIGVTGSMLTGGGWAGAYHRSRLSQIEIPEGQVRLVFNENPYGPSAKALEAVAHYLCRKQRTTRAR